MLAMVKIKICGLKRPQDIEFANALLPDYIGFVFAKGSKRYVSPERAVTLGSALSPKIKKVGVFTSSDVEQIALCAEKADLDVVQLHGMQSADFVKKLRARLGGVPIWYCLGAQEEITAFPELPVQVLVLDTQTEAGFGGTGTAFCWDKAKGLSGKYPLVLAGGLTAENVSRAVQTVQPFCVDVSSGVEQDGVKCFEKMKQFIYSVRSNENVK